MTAITDVRQTVRDIGEPALAALDGIDVEQQSQADPALDKVMQRLVRLRDVLIAQRREGQDCDEWLTRINRVLSGIFGVEYPVGGIQWQRIAEARDDLRDMLDSLEEYEPQ